uniref:Uncharacterized protein n=1 Tax=Candidatus Kentrum sp. SD TaxID=2126332 RepID=A0A450Y5D2_9GAMM|nr:MAG: hypothetical protein BECKSD772F_GA0070984_100458 [Candidatus Kentron sp. SD]VFK40304.1 MAG: hypothetical protein BECKSD772E_GA0070983_100558 [Candidatus Kentron sp. SD]
MDSRILTSIFMARSSCFKGRWYPAYIIAMISLLRRDGYDIESTWFMAKQGIFLQIMSSCHYDPLSFTIIDTLRTSTKMRTGAKPNLHKDNNHILLGLMLIHDEINFTEVATVVSFKRFHTLATQIIFSQSFRPNATFTGRRGARQSLAKTPSTPSKNPRVKHGFG